MLIKKTEDQPIKGVRIRERAFYTFAGCFAFSLVLCAVLLFPIPTLLHGDLFLCAVMYLLGLIPLSFFGWAMYAFRTVRCILTPDRLCFFDNRELRRQRALRGCPESRAGGHAPVPPGQEV